MEYQVVELLPGQRGHEVSREAVPIPSDRPVQIPGRNAVKRSQVPVQHHLLATDEQDDLLDAPGRNLTSRLSHSSLTPIRIANCETDNHGFHGIVMGRKHFEAVPSITAKLA